VNLVNAKGAVQSWTGKSQICCTASTVGSCWAQASQTCFGGSHAFSTDPAAPGTSFTGSITAGKMAFQANAMTFPMPLLSAGLLKLTLKKPHILGNVSATGIVNGVLAGAIPKSEVASVIIPAMAKMVDDVLKDPTSQQQVNDTISTLFDSDKNGTITAAEMANNAIIKTFLSGDVDVDGDGVMELSIGLGFTAVRGTIKP
jgi:hypothetical protein